MLSEILTPHRIQFGAADDWEDAVRRSFTPLVNDGAVEGRYVDAVVTAIEAPRGTYMDLGFGITLAHSRPEDGVVETSVAFLLLEDPVDLAGDTKHPMHLVIALAAADQSTHRTTMATIAKILVDEDSRSQLLVASSSEQVLDIVRRAES